MLSQNAEKLLKILKETGGHWKGNLIEIFFEKPEYKRDPESQKKYWQFEANEYGRSTPISRPVGSESVEFVGTENYSAVISEAYQELRKAGLANERNNGYNEYWLYPTKK